MALKMLSKKDLMLSVMEKVGDFWQYLSSYFIEATHITIMAIEENGEPLFVVGNITKIEMQKIVDLMPETFDDCPRFGDVIEILKPKDRPDDGSY